MNTSPDAAAVEQEIRALTATLRSIEDRLDELTAGQVDSISDREGRTFFLQRAQEGMALAEALRLDAILNSLPASVALLDTNGFIVAINESWRRFAATNGMRGSAADTGSNYLDACLDAHGDHPDGATWVADGLSSVLGGKARQFSTEYACHSTDRQCWFHMTASQLSEERADGVIVMHLDITERKTDELALSQERARLVAAQRVAKVGSWETDLATMQVDWTEEAYRIHEIASGPEAMTHARFLALVHPEDRNGLDRRFQDSLESTGQFSARHRLLLPGDRIKFIEERWEIMRDEGGRPTRVIGTCQDVTESHQSERRIERLNRGYHVLSHINMLIVRVRDQDELFREACRIAVESGGFSLAWIGSVRAEDARIVPVASAPASASFLGSIGEILSLADDTPMDAGLSALAVRTGEAMIVNDVATDPRVHLSELFSATGVLSLIALPILVDRVVVAVLCLHASEADYFDAAEVQLLQELASDIGFAIDHIRKTEQINHLAYYDEVTGLANQTLFLERAAQYLRSAAAIPHGAAMVLVDLERFKSINDSLGVHAGDGLLKQVAAWLADHLDDPTLLARVGSDHFALVLTDTEQPGDSARSLVRMIKEFHDQPFLLDGAPFRIAAKFGIAVFPEDAGTAPGLFQKAESALKNAKASGNRHLFYTQAMTDSIARKLRQENQLRHALDNDEFILHYQPKLNVLSGKVVSAEALIRWKDPRTQTLIPPVQFIPILEETGLIVDVGRWAMQQAIDDYLRWHQAGLEAVRVAVNVSPIQLRDPGFIDDVRQLLLIDPLASSGLDLEITESMIMTDIEQSMVMLRALRQMGIRIAIDDFGTGFSSLGYLSKLPVDALKIDRSFIADMGNSPQALSLVSTMISLAHSFNLEVVAEGVETDEQSRLLQLLHCDEAQGYLYSKPLESALFEERYLQP